MTDLCTADTSDGGSAQIRASKSDLSIANSSPRLESNATTSTACINDAPPLRRDLSSELLCPLCDQLFDRPVMVACGHSYCEQCIERHTRDTDSCVICKHDVGPLKAMIPSITLDNMVRKLKNQDNIETSYDDLFICEEKLQKETTPPVESKVVRTLSQHSKRRLFFSITASTICSSPITPHRRRPLSPSARPVKSSLKIPPESMNSISPQHEQHQQQLSPGSVEYKNHSVSSSQNEDSILAGAASLFRRNGFGRRSERATSATMSKSRLEDFDESMQDSTKLADESDGQLKRNSFFRRSLNVIRSKTPGVRSSLRKSMIPNVVPEDSEVLIPHREADDNVADEKLLQKDGKSNMKSLWKRLFLSKKSSSSKVTDKVQLLRHEKIPESMTMTSQVVTTTISFVRLENQHDDPQEPYAHLLNSNFALGYYTGIGRKFERIAGGSEITLVVFGHAMAGKTTFVRSIRQLFLEGTDRIRVIPIAERYRLAGIGMMPFPEGDNRLPHIVSLVINNDADDVEYVLDIIDPEYDNSNLPQAYMDACDAAFLLIDSRNCQSLLSALQIQRNMKSAQHAHVQCEMLMNIPSEESGQVRVLSSHELETTASKKATTTIRELCVNHLDRAVVEEMLLSMCERVTSFRKPAVPPPSATSSSSSSPNGLL